MNITELKKSGRIIYEFISGSHAYGLNTPTSDIDIRGLFCDNKKELLSLSNGVPDVIQDSKNDVSYYSIRRFFELAKDCNPNIIEFLFMPKDVIKIYNPIFMDLIFRNSHLFISKKCKHTFCGYAYAQIKKCKGNNKWVNNPKPSERPVQKDFCWVIPDKTDSKFSSNDIMKFRPIRLSEWEKIVGFNIKDCICSKVEHAYNLYRLYNVENNSKGVFRDGEIITNSVSIEEEKNKCCGILIFNSVEFERATDDWKNYWEWFKNRNVNRWISQERGEIDYDSKNVMHCIRILKSGINILKNGEPLIRFNVDETKFLMDVRNGKFLYDDIIKVSEELVSELDSLYETSTVNHSVDSDKINDLYLSLLEISG